MVAAGCLAGIKILDLSRVLAAPYATMALGDLGADVIKVERPDGGDETRQWGPPFICGESTYFLAANRNKRSIALDFANPSDRSMVRDLALHWADVVVENFRPGTLDKWQLGSEQLLAESPQLVVASVRGYPQGDDRPGYDFIIQAESGLMSITGPVDGEPSKVGIAVADILTGMFLANGITAALYRRQVTGQGEHVVVSLWGSQLAALSNVMQSYLVTKRPPSRYGNAHAQLAPYQTFHTKDGLIALAAGNDGQFFRLCAALDHEEWASDPRFLKNPDRVTHREALTRVLESVLGQHSTDHWVKRLRQRGLPAAPVQTIPQAVAEAQAQGHDLVGSVEHKMAGPLSYVKMPWTFKNARQGVQSAPPPWDGNREEIMKLVATIRRTRKDG